MLGRCEECDRFTALLRVDELLICVKCARAKAELEGKKALKK